MGKKDKRRNKVKRFVQQRQKTVKSSDAIRLSPNVSTSALPQIQSIVHEIGSVSSSADDCTITENTSLKAITSTYESITPVNNSVPNSLPRSHSINIAPLPVDSTNSDIAPVTSIPALDLEANNNNDNNNNHDDNSPVSNNTTQPSLDVNIDNNTSTRSIRSVPTLSDTRKWFSIGLVYLISIVIGWEWGHVWIHQTKISSHFEQLYNMINLQIMYLLGVLLIWQFQFLMSLKRGIITVLTPQLIGYVMMRWANCFHEKLLARLIIGISTGLFITDTQLFFEDISNFNYKVPFHIVIGILLSSMIQTSNCPVFYGILFGISVCTLLIGLVILPTAPSTQVEALPPMINKKNTLIVVCYIAIQFSLSLTKVSAFVSFLVAMAFISMYIHFNKKSTVGKLLLKCDQDKRHVLIRALTVMMTIMTVYCLPVYLDIFEKRNTCISVMLFAVFIGMILSRYTTNRIALLVILFDILALITYGFTQRDNIISIFDNFMAMNMLFAIGVTGFVIVVMNSKPLTRELHNTYIFEALVVLFTLTLTDYIVSGCSKRLIYERLVRVLSKKYSHREILNFVDRSSKSIGWTQKEAPKKVATIILRCYNTIFNKIIAISTLFFVIICVYSALI